MNRLFSPLETLLNADVRINFFRREVVDVKSEYERQLKMVSVCMTYTPRKKLKLAFLGKMAE